MEQKAKGHTSGFEHPVIEERIYPERTFENPQTIIAIALAYPTKIKEKSRGMKNAACLPVPRGASITMIFCEND